MNGEVQKRIFEPFFTTKQVGKGTGMGLAAVYGTVKNHRGTIEVQSKVGEGTSMKIFLPLAISVCKVNADKTSEPAAFEGKLRLLIIDDEETVCRLGKEMLEMRGHSVEICRDSVEAVELFKNIRDEVDIVILDMVMPKLNGTETFCALKEIDPDVRVLLLSGYSLTGEAQNLLDKGAHGFIQKPFTEEELTKTIAEIFT
jgi:CheY-like chemotaxis protein